MKTLAAIALLAMLALVAADTPACDDCPTDFRPVCGRIGGENGTQVTFDNECHARCNTSDVLHNGTCEGFPVERNCFCPLELRPVCAIRFLRQGGAKRETMTNACVAKCEHAEILHDGDCPPLPKFPTRPCIASNEYRPVCALVTRVNLTRDFANAEAARCANAHILHPGRCNNTNSTAPDAAPLGPDGQPITHENNDLPDGFKQYWPNQDDDTLFPVGSGGESDDCTSEGPQQSPQGSRSDVGPRPSGSPNGLPPHPSAGSPSGLPPPHSSGVPPRDQQVQQQQSGMFPGQNDSPFAAFPTAPQQAGQSGQQGGRRCGVNGASANPAQTNGGANGQVAGAGGQMGGVGAGPAYDQSNPGVGSGLGAGSPRGNRDDHALLVAAVALCCVSIAMSAAVLISLGRITRSMGMMTHAPLSIRAGSTVDVLPAYASGKVSPSGKRAIDDAFEREPTLNVV